MKRTPGPATLNNFRNWVSRLAELNAVLDPKPFFENVAYTKIRQFSAEALAYEISDMRGIKNDSKRCTLLLSLLHQTQLKTRDELVDMFLRRMKRVQHTALDNLRNLQEKNRETEEELISVLGQVLQHAESGDANDMLGQHVRETLDARGGIETLNAQFKLVTAYHNDNYLPLLWPVHAVNRAVIFRVLDLIQIKSSTQDKSLLRALDFVCGHRKTRKDYLPPGIDLRFASQRWQTFIRTMDEETPVLDRRSLEVCVFIHLAEALQGGDLYVEDSGAYSDYRKQLMPWSECQKRLSEYCLSLDLPASAGEFVDSLREQLTKVAEKTDQGSPANGELTIDDDGTPHPKRQKASPLPEGLDDFKKEAYERMPERHLLDILKHVQYWSNYTRHFGPRPGQAQRYRTHVPFEN